MIKMTLLGRPITKKNHSRIVTQGNRRLLIPSQQYEQYEIDCLWQVPPKAKQRIDFPVNMQCVYFMPTKRAVDLVNLLEATCDILVNAGVLADDNCSIIAAHDGSRVFYDKKNPRVEITITQYTGPVFPDSWDGTAYINELSD